MSMVKLLVVLVIITALLSSAATLFLGWLAWHVWVRPRMDAHWLRMADEVEQRVRAGTLAGAQEFLQPLRSEMQQEIEVAVRQWLPTVRTELQAGLTTAAQDMLPAFRAEVRNGFTEALNLANAGALLDKTARKVVRASSSLVENSLNLLRVRPEERGRDEQKKQPQDQQ